MGSAIEQSGNEIISWLKNHYNLEIFTQQTAEDHFWNFLLEKSPDVIIVNATYPRIITPLFYYKKLKPNLKILLICRTTDDFYFPNQYKSQYERNYFRRLECVLNDSDKIVCVNFCNKSKNQIKENLRHKLINCCGINNENFYSITTPWNERKKKFVILGSLNPHKLSEKFIKLIQNTNLIIDCYGCIKNQPENYHNDFINCKNLTYLGELPYEKVPEILNQYKYYILPHNGYEPLCNSLIQSILCGCISLMSDDWSNKWSDWSNGLIFKANDENQLIENLLKLNEIDLINGNLISNYSRKKFIKKYSILKLKEEIINFINSCR